MDFEKHAFGFGVTTGLFLSYLDIQLAHYLQSLLWPLESSKMIEEYLPKILVALEKIAEPNSAEKWLVCISGMAAFLTVIAIGVAIWQAISVRNQTQKNLNLESDRIRLEMLKSLYSTAFNKLKISDSHAPKNDSMSWINSAKFLLNADLISAQFLTPEYKDMHKIEQSLWQIQFQNLLEFDQNHIKLDAQFFFGSPDFPNAKGLLQTKIETESEGLNLDPSAIAVIYLFAYKPDYLSNFVKVRKKEINADNIWELFNKEPFHIPETWDSAFKDNKQISISETGAYEYMILTTSIDLREQKDTEGIENKDYLSFDSQLIHDLNRMRFKFTNWTMQNPQSEKEELDNGPSYAYFLVIEPIELILTPNEGSNYAFSFEARLDEIYDKYWLIKSINGHVTLYMKRPKNIEKSVDDKFTVYVNQFELYDKNFKAIYAQFVTS